MPAPLRVHLSEAEDRDLLEFQKIEGIPSRVRERAEIVRLNHHGWSVSAIAKYKNKSPHTFRNMSKKVRERWSDWQEKGLFLFQLPKYSSEMNLIEIEWHQLKTHELAGRIFEDEYDLAIAVIDGVEARAQRGQHSTERFLFNSA